MTRGIDLIGHRRVVFLVGDEPARSAASSLRWASARFFDTAAALARSLREDQRIGERLVVFRDLLGELGDLVLGDLDLVLQRLQQAAALRRASRRASSFVTFGAGFLAARGRVLAGEQEAAIVVEIAVERLDLAVGDQQQAVRRRLDQAAVMADQDDGALEIVERDRAAPRARRCRDGWSARRGSAGWACRASPAPASAARARRPTACRPASAPCRADKPEAAQPRAHLVSRSSWAGSAPASGPASRAPSSSSS